MSQDGPGWPQVDGGGRKEKPRGGQGGTWGAKENNASLRSLADFPGVEDGSGRKRTGFVVENVSVLLLLLPLLSKFRPAKQQGGGPATICHLQSELWARLISRPFFPHLSAILTPKSSSLCSRLMRRLLRRDRRLT